MTLFLVLQVCSQWKDIALIMRDSEFKEDEEHLIDIFDVKVQLKHFIMMAKKITFTCTISHLVMCIKLAT